MTQPVKRTTTEAAKTLGLTVQTFRNRVKRAGIEAAEVWLCGTRGRPFDLWTAQQVKTLGSIKVKRGRPSKQAEA